MITNPTMMANDINLQLNSAKIWVNDFYYLVNDL